MTPPPQTSGVAIERAGCEQLDELEPLWSAMQEHHARVSDRVAENWPFRPNDESWSRRRASYESWLAQPEAFMLLARRPMHAVGYLLGRSIGGWTMIDTGNPLGQVESVCVLPEERGNGIGHQLMTRAHQEFAALGIETVGLSVFAENTDAIRFYEEQGMIPITITYMGRVPRSQAKQ